MTDLTATSIREAEETVTALERDAITVSSAHKELIAQLPALRAERTEAARAMLVGGAPRVAWQKAFHVEQEATSLLGDLDAVVALLDRDLVQARYGVKMVQHEAYMGAFAQRLHRVVTENNFSVPAAGSFVGDAAKAYAWLSTMWRTDAVDRTRVCTYWIDRMGSNVPTLPFIAAALVHGDIRVELGDHVISFGISENSGKPAASLPLTSDPTPSINRALITKIQPNYRAGR